MSRLPGTCSGCGARVELHLHGEGPKKSGNDTTTLAVWLEAGTDSPHQCAKETAA